MREILFRGKRKFPRWQFDNIWVDGYLLRYEDGDCDICSPSGPDELYKYSVHPSTVGQFTGLTDRNGTKIFEGDIVNILTENEESGVVEWENGGFVVNADGFCVDFHTNINGTDLEVIGNIHDNPELISEGKA